MVALSIWASGTKTIAQGHIKMISFSPVRDIPLRFISLNLNFLAPFDRIYLIFEQTIRQVHDPSHLKIFGLPKIFRRVIR